MRIAGVSDRGVLGMDAKLKPTGKYLRRPRAGMLAIAAGRRLEQLSGYLFSKFKPLSNA